MNSSAGPLISIVTPVYGGACLEALYQRVVTAVSSISDNLEIVMVNDASPDNAWETIGLLARADARVRGIDLADNVGQHVAILAGLDHARGQWVVVMDCDLQDRPEEIPRLYQAAGDEFDIVLARRIVRQHAGLRLLGSKAFYAVLRLITGIRQDHTVGNFGLYRRPAIEAILANRERYYFPLLVRSVAFSTTSIDVQHDVSKVPSSYSVAKLINLALITIRANCPGVSTRQLANVPEKRNVYRVRRLCGAGTQEVEFPLLRQSRHNALP